MNPRDDMRPFSAKQGFTLIEITVVLALIGIFLFVTLPSFNVGGNTTDSFSRKIIVTVNSLKKRAVADGKDYALYIDMDEGKLLVADTAVSEEDLEKNLGGEDVPEGIEILDVEFPTKGKIASGIVAIRFYQKGYSDKAIIHIEDDDSERKSFLIEPFLPKVKLFDEYTGFDS